MKAEGRVFKYGDNVDTDVIIPARYLNSSDPKELATHCMEDIDKDFDQFLKMFTWNYIQKQIIKQENITVSADEATAEAKAFAQAQFAQYGMPSAPDDMLAGYAKQILENKEQGQKIYEKLYEVKVVEDVKSKVKVTEKAVSADDFAKLAKEL